MASAGRPIVFSISVMISGLVATVPLTVAAGDSQNMQRSDWPPGNEPISKVGTCEGSIEYINGVEDAKVVRAANLIGVDGWMALSAKAGTTPEIVYVTLSAADGGTIYTAAQRTERPDLEVSFAHRTMRDAGFTATMDASSLPGDLTLSLARENHGHIEICDNFKRILSRGVVPETIAEPIPFDHVDGSISVADEQQVAKCEGNIDGLNGKPPNPQSNTVTGAMDVRGWATIAGKEGIVPDAVFARIEGPDGKVIYVKMRALPRGDIKHFFANPDLPDAGFIALIDTSKLDGPYILGFSRLNHGKLERCDQLKIPITVNH
jgi:hypothetical protein